MSWISAAELARRAGCTRAAVGKAISSGRISAEHVRRASGRVLVDEAAGLSAIRPASAPPAAAPVKVQPTELSGLFAWGAAPPAEADDSAEVVALLREIQQLERKLAAIKERESAWIVSYRGFRDWAANSYSEAERIKRGGWPGKDLGRALWDELGEQPLIGDVMVTARQMVLDHLKFLDQCDLASRFPK